jgi:hypothetical protein
MSETSNASVPELTPMASVTPSSSAISCSKASTSGPMTKRWLSQTRTTAESTSSRMPANCAWRSSRGTRIT